MSTTRRLAITAGMASYLDAGALVTTGLAIGAFYADGLALSGTAVGVLLGLQTMAFAIGAVVGGMLGDRLGRRRMLVGAIVLYVVGVGLLAVAGGMALLVCGVVLSGLAIGGDLPTSLAMISEEAPAGQKGRLVALTQVLWAAGIGVTALLAVVIGDLGVTTGRLLYLHLLVVALVVLGRRVDLKESAEWSAARRARSTMSADRVGAADRSRVGLADHLHGPLAPVVVALGLYYSLWNLGANTVGQFRAHLWVDVLDGTARGASILMLISVPLGIAGSFYFLRKVDGLRRSTVIGVGFLLSGTGWLVAAVWPSRETFVLLVVLFVLGAALSGEAAYKVWTQELVPTLHRASVAGLTLAAARCVAALFAFVTPGLASLGLHVLFGVILAAYLLCVLVALAWIPRLQRRV